MTNYNRIIDEDLKLTRSFSLHEFGVSSSYPELAEEIEFKYGDVLLLKEICEKSLQPIRNKFGFPGLSDICGYIPGDPARPLFWEVKKVGGKLRPEQKVFLEKASADGAFAGHGTVDALMDQLEDEGLLPNR